jgi:hypothetical protein
VTEKTLRASIGQLLLGAPWWLVGLLIGLPIGFAIGLAQGLLRGDLALGLFSGVLYTLLWGLWFGLTVRRKRLDRPLLAPVPVDKHDAARRAVFDDLLIPSDPEVRDAARRLATHRLADYDRAWPWIRGASAVCAAAGMIGAFFLLPMLWLVGLAAMIVAPLLYLRRRLRQRIPMLHDDATAV